MATLIQELTEVLNEQNIVYQKLLDIAAKKKVAIIENDIQKIQGFVDEENGIVGRGLKLEKKRTELFVDMADVLNKPNITISQIIDAVKGQDGEKELNLAKEKAADLLPKLKNINEQNQELIKISLEYLDFSVNALRSETLGVPSYFDSSGNEINLSDKKMFDTKQ